MCTNLSNDIFDNQSSLGKAEPGRQNKIVKKISAAMGKINLRVVAMGKEMKIKLQDFDMLRLLATPPTVPDQKFSF